MTLQTKETAFRAAFAKAGIDPAEAELSVRAVEILRENKLDLDRSVLGFARLLRGNDALLHALVRSYISDIRADMRGEGLLVAGQLEYAIHKGIAGDEHPVEDGVGQKAHASSAITKVPNPSSRPSVGGGQAAFETHYSDAATHGSPAPAGGGQPGRDAHMRHAPSGGAQKANPGQARVGFKEKLAAQALILEYRMLDGRRLGNLRIRELIPLAERNEREARVLRFLKNYYANPDPAAFVRDLYAPKTIEAALAFADQEAAHAAA